MNRPEENLPRVLLVDDSESVLAFEKAALGNYYSLDTARDGKEALDRLAAFRPAALVLDLSMPVMDGDEVLRRLRRLDDPDLAEAGVLVLSTETQRARACLELGADDFLAKPVDPGALRSRVASCLDAAARRAENRQAIFLFLLTGGRRLALPVSSVVTVAPRCALRPLPGAPSFVRGFFDLYGEPVAVMDLALHLGWENRTSLTERKLVVLRVGQALLAVEVDEVQDPEAFGLDEITPGNRVSAGGLGHLERFLEAMVRVGDGELLPVIRPESLVRPGILPRLLRALKQVSEGAAA